MAKKKSDAQITQISFKVSAEIKSALEDSARLSRCDVSDILRMICAEFVKANKPRITKFRQQAAKPLKLPCATPPTKTAADEKGDDSHEND